MDIAIKYDKISLGNEKFVFKPVCIIKGKYDEETETFETDYGELCAPIDGESQFEDSYFGCFVNMEELKESYKGQGLTEEEMLAQYFDDNVMFYCLGQFDYITGRIQTLFLPYEDTEKFFTSGEDVYKLVNDDVKISFSLEKLEELCKIDNIDELRTQLNKVVNITRTIMSQNGIVERSSVSQKEEKIQTAK